MSAAMVIGGGLAGCEAAWQLAQRGVSLDLYEMRPGTPTPAHRTDLLAELVCSNSLKSDLPTTANGLLKRELRLLDSLILKVAEEALVPAGSALAVDRRDFAARVTDRIQGHPLIRVIREEIRELPRDVPLVLASGPLTSSALSASVQEFLGDDNLFFFDAIAPIVAADSLDRQKIFAASRYGKGAPAYLNCPLTQSQYLNFYDRLIAADTVPLPSFEQNLFFESCMPVEESARRGTRTLLFGPMRAVGLTDPRTGRRPHAVVQLRQEDTRATLYNMVGFQTRLRQGQQREVFRLIPGLEGVEFLRYGSIHRNTFICAPRTLLPTMQVQKAQTIFLGGQLTGGEGYMESVATGLLAGLNLARLLSGSQPVVPPGTTAMGSLVGYITGAKAAGFQPMNVNFGLLPSLEHPPRDRQRRNEQLVDRSLEDFTGWMKMEGVESSANHRGNGQEISDLTGAGEKLLREHRQGL